jgi:hypothetical protein
VGGAGGAGERVGHTGAARAGVRVGGARCDGQNGGGAPVSRRKGDRHRLPLYSLQQLELFDLVTKFTHQIDFNMDQNLQKI